MSQQQIKDTGSEIILPSPPEIVQELRSISADASSLGTIIAKDPELAQEVLETINAPYFNLVRKISSIDEAVRFLGQDRITKLTTARSLRTACITRSSSFLEEVWSSSNRVAIVAVLLAKELNKSSVEEAYELGLFHNIGMAILFNNFDNYRSVIRAAYKHESGAITAFELHHLQQEHANIGAALSKKWHLSEKLVLIIKNHHNLKWIEQQFKEESDKELLDLVCILKLAELFSHLSGYIAQIPTNHEWLKLSDTIMDYLDLNTMKLEKLKRAITEKLSEIKI
ncbi:MAG: HDOD domain-containing protein [Oleispira sp.]|nr:HDOD domain-containing protein [Oleispira sp.]MBL4882204.1 HDOD domain-containing protein [Oleispira sp.]